MYDLGRLIAGLAVTLTLTMAVIVLLNAGPAVSAVVGGLIGLIGGHLSAEWASRW